MMEAEEIIKVVNGIYKNILENFNPGARQMINAGKAYLKALHDAAAASRIYVDAIGKLAQQAQQDTWGGSSDIGSALMKIVEVYKEIQEQQVNILKAFYVDLLVPLETNLEKDTKVIQSERKRFVQQHKQRLDTYIKTTALMKKQRKKVRGSGKSELAMDKELKNMKLLEIEKSKLDLFYEQSLKNAMTQERRRYGFVLERQCSLSKHYLSYYTYGMEAFSKNIDQWSEVAKTRETLPKSGESLFSSRLGQMTSWQDGGGGTGDDVYSNPRSGNFDEDSMSMNSQLRKTKSVDASCLDIRSMDDAGSPVSTLYRARSEYNLKSSAHSPTQENGSSAYHSKSSSTDRQSHTPWHAQIVRAMYAYLSSGENQLSFHEGDLVALIGERNKGWQFGENLRTQCTGWFPLAYTEIMNEPILSPVHTNDVGGYSDRNGISHEDNGGTTPTTSSGAPSGNSTLEQAYNTRKFGDSLHRFHANAKQIRRAVGSNSIPPPAAPAPEPKQSPSSNKKSGQQHRSRTRSTKMEHQSDSNSMPSPHSGGIKTSLSAFNLSNGRSDRGSGPPNSQEKGGQTALHGSNDSGFSVDPRQQPEVDYSDDEVTQQKRNPSRRRIIRQIEENNNVQNTATINRRSNTLKQARSQVNLVENNILSDNPQDLTKDSKTLIKRSKSFWKFGKNSSSTEILEGMALWKHKDLINVKLEAARNNKKDSMEEQTSDGDESSDSDTINNNNINDGHHSSGKNSSTMEPKVKERSYQQQKRMNEKSYSPRASEINANDNFKMVSDYNKCFHEDDDDGLMLKTINRKKIVQQYANSSSGSDSETESDVTTDDPYDCIIVNDQKITKTKSEKNYFPNVSEIGRKLEEFSKYNNKKNIIQEKNNMNIIMYRSRDSSDDIIPYGEKRNTFKTFQMESQNETKQQEETYYNESTIKRNKNKDIQDYQDEWESKSKMTKSRNRSSYESIDSENDNERHSKSERISKHKQYYDSNTEDGLSDSNKGRQTMEKNKSKKHNSKYEDRSSREYDDDTLKQRYLKNGNMYGPWYDLWGLDSTGEVQNKQ
ncbi:unnamed protein product [Acanthoscelides obtectus]|uniref:Brain-specific angiogenesis inhibitor 1-associated protein 2 n=2 Tax=Acanthoscelides obtectus TaxID=200917 RepID=A0A9P0LMX9_ACAOB|nr:unnamed protein product [Acanthoscelides obtectus]CAK1668622.1 Brain-specific angiogenesis inhibitor 1-associated protein 2-like protein 1 [Acanthoscelides obtectus]